MESSDGQENIFSTTGGGAARMGSNTQPAAWAALLFDYATRRLFFSYEPRVLYAGDIETYSGYSMGKIVREK